MQSVIERKIQDWYKRNSLCDPSAAEELRELKRQLRQETERIQTLRQAFLYWKELHILSRMESGYSPITLPALPVNA